MKRILILTNVKSFERDKTTFKKFLSPEKQADYTVDVYCLEQLLFWIHQHIEKTVIRADGVDIASYDLVWIKRSAGSSAPYAQVCALYLNTKGVRFLSSDILVNTSAEYNKLKEHMFFSIAGLPFPATRFINQHNFEQFLRTNPGEYPLVVKSVVGSRGSDNYLIRDESEFRDLMKEQTQDYLVQPYIESDVSYRVLVFGYEAKLCIKKVSTDKTTHINTVAQGSDAVVIALSDVDPRVVSISTQVASAMKREITGTDIIIEKSTGEPYLLEANRPPSIEHGALAEQKGSVLAEYIESLVEES